MDVLMDTLDMLRGVSSRCVDGYIGYVEGCVQWVC